MNENRAKSCGRDCVFRSGMGERLGDEGPAHSVELGVYEIPCERGAQRPGESPAWGSGSTRADGGPLFSPVLALSTPAVAVSRGSQRFLGEEK